MYLKPVHKYILLSFLTASLGSSFITKKHLWYYLFARAREWIVVDTNNGIVLLPVPAPPRATRPPPVVITNPDLIKYLIFQLFAEATLVVTLVVLSAMALREEWMHAMRRWKRRKSRIEESRKEGVE